MPIPSTLFRHEALEHHFGSRGCDGDLLCISPAWTNCTYWLLVWLLVAGSSYAIFGPVNEYANGTAIVRDQRRTTITALSAGTVAGIAVRPGQRVSVNEPLVHFNDMQERIELNRVKEQLKLRQINRLEDPNDPVPLQQLAALRSELETAAKRLNCQTVLAPRGGIVRDLRIRPHQLIAAGELLLTIVDDDSDPLTVIAILPGQYRPLIKVGNPLRLELAGFRYAYQPLTIDSVGNEVVGPAEVRRFVGQEIADSLILQGPSVIVQAHPQSRKFNADGHWLEYHDGMQGRVAARLRSERILLSLVPGLRAVFERRREEVRDEIAR